MAVSQVKLRTLYIMKMLLEKTDEKYTMSAADIDKALCDYGMSADRKTVYNDIETLREFGMDVLQTKGSNSGYYIGSRKFELPELKLLVDAVQASKFISRKKSEELIRKLESLASEHDARQLQRNVFIYNRPKTGNETIYYNVDKIHTAILENRQIQYQYAEWTVKKELIPKKNGAVYTVSPWSLTWDDANYYLIAYDEASDCMKHYRVDKMQRTRVIRQERVGKERFQDFDLVEFSKKTFSMYGGHDEEVTLQCGNELIGVILDRFGTDVMIVPADEGQFRVRVLVAVSPQFFGWVTGIGVRLRIAGPERVQKEYKEYLEGIMEGY
ncbi:WYL domain-containing protein [Lachnospiraceae bacterium WCA-9-b2]|uniref:WYL domain-containing protein n=1 Tax=Sporofaciens musculi TaxID=2681861 RepID=A0A7X3SLJ0_9FIRM|nr:transcriptional regulator [Sporofaciens musculi]MXP78699.1 WYL domain-containing protein [Sporofaciens musculi]